MSMSERQIEKDKAVGDLWKVLELLTLEQREPDGWERLCLVRGYGALFAGMYSLGSWEAWLALTPAEERSPSAKAAYSEVDQYSLSTLQKIHEFAVREPTRLHMTFGGFQLTT